MSYTEVNQSGKIEQFGMDTVVALSNGEMYFVLIPKKVKQDLFIKYKSKIRGLKYKLFCIAIYYCLDSIISSETKIIICPEYLGQDLLLKSELVNLLVKNSKSFSHELISFEIITKKKRST